MPKMTWQFYKSFGKKSQKIPYFFLYSHLCTKILPKFMWLCKTVTSATLWNSAMLVGGSLSSNCPLSSVLFVLLILESLSYSDLSKFCFELTNDQSHGCHYMFFVCCWQVGVHRLKQIKVNCEFCPLSLFIVR